MIVALAISVVAAAVGQVQLRAGQALPAPEVLSAVREGVVVGREGQAEFVIGWDRVLRVEGPEEAASLPFLTQGEELWRARTRLEREDAAAAEPIFERLLPELAPMGGPMPAVAAEGLLRCRLRRGAQVAAVEPWLAWLRAMKNASVDGARAFSTDWAAQAGLDPIMDPATGLIPALPPIWLDWPAVRVFATSGGAAPSVTGGEVDGPQAMANLYLHAARFETGAGEAVPGVGASSDPGVALVLDIVRARAGGEGERAEARGRLAQRLAGVRDPWMEAWCRAAIGRSLVRESDAEVRRLGVVQLLHLPARFSRIHPYLAGVCLAEASVTLAELGDRAGAAALRNELIDDYPDHPVLAWEKVRMPVAGLAGFPAPAGGSGPGHSPRVIPLSITECLLP